MLRRLIMAILFLLCLLIGMLAEHHAYEVMRWMESRANR